MSEFNVGDRVKAVGSTGLYRHNVGKDGVVTEIDLAGDIHVAFSDGETDYGRDADFLILPPAVNTEALKAALMAALMAAVEAAEAERACGVEGKSVMAHFANELLEKHFNLLRVPATGAKWVEKEIAA